jgi:hypothetical protein
MIIPSNLSDAKNTNQNTSQNIKPEYDVVTKVNLDILDNMQIKREVYYKMNFIMKYLENHWAIKKRKKIFFFKNLETSSKEIITEDYLNRRIVEKLYSSSANKFEYTDNAGTRETRETRETRKMIEINKSQSISQINSNTNQKGKKDIISLEDGINALRYMIENQKIDINSELKNKIYVMHFVMNTLENGWTIRKKSDNFVFRKKHKNHGEIYSDDYLINFLKINVKIGK